MSAQLISELHLSELPLTILNLHSW